MAERSYRVNLYQDGDFWIREKADAVRKCLRYVPNCIVKHGLRASGEGLVISGFDIRFFDLGTRDWLDMEFELYEYFLPSFWTRLRSHTDNPSSDWPLVGPYGVSLPGGAEGFPVDSEFTNHFKIPTPVLCLLHVWEDYRMRNSNRTMSRYEFGRWLFRIACVIHDLIAVPMREEADWRTRWAGIRGVLGSPYGFDFASYVHAGWYDAAEEEWILQRDATEYRQADACMMLNEFSALPKKDSDPLWMFIGIFLDSLAQTLLTREMILECSYCRRYMLFRRGKDKCSGLKDGRDCSGAERSKRKHHRDKRKQRRKRT